MRALMGYRLVLLGLAVASTLVLAACGKQIGDGCNLSSDCSPNGDRLCDPDPQSPGGYCTIQGCDVSTCPDEAVCVRFFTGSFSNPPNATCSGSNATVSCSLDEVCALFGRCVPRSSEVRYCMLKCGSDGDCRGGYECRNLDKMVAHGGEPVLSEGTPVDAAHAPKFCAVKPKS
jgi:hypothetical protein